jgi:hypothetical protein
MKALLALVTAVATLAFASSALGDTLITDTLAPGGKPAPAQGYRFITDTLAPGGGSSAPVAVRSSGGFSWSDAGVGAGAAVGGVLALFGSALIVARRQGRLAV